MKETFITLLILSGIHFAASAQTRGLAEFGVNVGLNEATVENSNTAERSSYTTGVNLGVSGEYYFNDRWSIKAKLIYDQKGWGNGFLILNDGTEIDGIDYRLNYITVPVMASWHFGRLRNWYLHFGPYIGFLTSASESSNSGADIKSALNSVDGGLALGIGVKIPISKTANFFVEYDGQGGVGNVFKQSDGTYQNVRSSFNVGLSFPVR